jgi:hypothetical protein
MVFLRIGSKDAQLPRLLGAFLIVLSVLMLIRGGAVMFDSWNSLKNFNTCVESSGVRDLQMLGNPDYISAELRYQDCRNTLFQMTGAQVQGDYSPLTQRQFWTALIGPISQFFVWAIALLIGLFAWANPSIVIPIEQVTLESSFAKRRRK